MRDRSSLSPTRGDVPSPTRRDVLALGVGALVVASIPLAVRERRRALVRRKVPCMGTIAEIAVVADDPLRAEAAIDAAIAELEAVERAMTRHVRTSEIGQANEDAARRRVSVSGPTAAVLASALRWAETTAGRFDPCFGGAVVAWDVERRREPLPAAEAARWADRRLWQGLDLRPDGTLRLGSPDARIDLGGIAKGYGVDRAVDALRARGVSRALVNVGGDLYALGDSEDGDPWTVGVQSPSDSGALVATLEVKDQAVATSGDYLRGFTWQGRRYHHLLDPATAQPWQTRHTLSIRADDCVTADAAATAVYGLPGREAEMVLAGAAPSARIVHSG